MRHAADSSQPSPTADREIVLSRTFAAPPALVFSAWTDPRHLVNWWGPRGFVTTTTAHDLRPGGLWVYEMHGPDGVDYPNWVRWLTIERPHRLVYEHGGVVGTPAVFIATIDFAAVDGGTRVTMRSLFPTAAARDQVVQRYGAIEGGKQHLERMAELVALLAPATPAEHAVRHFTRTFAAPRALVFQAWTDPEHLRHWWGPHDFTNPTCRFEARRGGYLHIDMRGPDGITRPLKGEVREIEAPSRLVCVCYPTDDHGKPLFEVTNTVTFADAAGGGTTVTVETDVRAIAPEARIPHDGMVVGWTQSLERLEDFLADPAAAREPARDIANSRVFAAPRARVFAAWTDPALLARWWGPKGFSNTFQVCEPRAGGEWRFTMHGPDGTDYHNHSRFDEVRPGELVAFTHLGPMHAFVVRATFYDLDGATLVRFRMRFATAGETEKIRPFIAQANEQNFDRLAEVLAAT